MSRYTDEQIIAAIDNAPEPVRSVIRDIETSRTIGSIGKTYGIHIDTIGKVAELNRNLLIGLMSPAEVLGELIMAGVDTDTAKNILKELNERIFMPVQAKMRLGSTPPPVTSVSRNPSQEGARPIADPPHLDLGTRPQASFLPHESAVVAPATQEAEPAHGPTIMPAPHNAFTVDTQTHPPEEWRPTAAINAPLQSAQTGHVSPVLTEESHLSISAQEPPTSDPLQAARGPVPAILPGQELRPLSTPLIKERENDPYREPIA